MATEQLPEFPALRALRWDYVAAIAATQEHEVTAKNTVFMSNMPAYMHRKHEDAYEELHRRQRVEREAGRAYMAALAEADPACRVCGCTTEDACWDDEHGPCCWVEDELCSACAGNA